MLFQQADGNGDAYVGWLERRGAHVKRLDEARLERDLASAQAVVVAGSHADLHPALYGEVPRAELDSIDLTRDRRDLAALRTAREHDGICRGHQLRDRRFAVGVLWHPEADDAGAGGEALADALLEAA